LNANNKNNSELESKSQTEKLEQLMNRAKNWNWDRAVDVWRELHPTVRKI